ncbi:hypothetical protein MASR2M48_30360 [Spirochaetota bacterium]
MWYKDGDAGLSYRTTVDTLMVGFGERVLFYPFGANPELGSPLRVELILSKYSADELGPDASEYRQRLGRHPSRKKPSHEGRFIATTLQKTGQTPGGSVCGFGLGHRLRAAHRGGRSEFSSTLSSSIEPSIGEPGSLLLITGKHFGSGVERAE